MIFPLPQLETSNIKISFFITSSLSPSLEFLRKYKIEVKKDKVSINVRNEEKIGVKLKKKYIHQIRNELKETFQVKLKKKYKIDEKKISNIKISFFITSSLSPSLEILRKYKIRIYKDFPQLINVTGIRSLDDVNQIRNELEEKFDEKTVDKYRVDNIMASRKVNLSLSFDFKKIIKRIRKKGYDKIFHVVYDQEYAQRIFLKPREKPFPSIQLLYTGSVTVMGCKSINHLIFSQNVIDCLYSLKTLNKKNQPKLT